MGFGLLWELVDYVIVLVFVFSSDWLGHFFMFSPPFVDVRQSYLCLLYIPLHRRCSLRLSLVAFQKSLYSRTEGGCTSRRREHMGGVIKRTLVKK
jgi:hypothetical protein